MPKGASENFTGCEGVVTLIYVYGRLMYPFVDETFAKRTLWVLCFGVLCGILIATLWPFNPFPRNDVSWIQGTGGLHFGENGIIRGFIPTSRGERPCSLELWLQAASDDDTNTILGFYTPGNPQHFGLRQYVDGLLVVRELGKEGAILSRMELDHIFRKDKLVWIAISSGDQHGTSLYVDGQLVTASPKFKLRGVDCSGELTIGNSSVTYDTFQGELRGLAIYDQELTQMQIQNHYSTWTTTGLPQYAYGESAIAVYALQERAGSVLRNEVKNGPDIMIPKSFAVFHKPMLLLPWQEFSPTWNYVNDVLRNIAGFVPLGLLLCACLWEKRGPSQAFWLTILFGGSLSLVIEILQAYIPRRSSGVTDIITNTLGAAVGALLCYWKPISRFFSKVGLTNLRLRN
jgi:VanZ family protein